MTAVRARSVTEGLPRIVAARSARGQASVLLVGALAALLVGVLVLGAVARGVAQEAAAQRAVDLAALAGARAMLEANPRLFEPATIDGVPNPRHLTRDAYLALARDAAERVARGNGVGRPSVAVPDGGTFAPTSIRVAARAVVEVRRGDERRSLRFDVSAEAEVAPALFDVAAGAGYDGPLAYRQGKPMRPDVALAFDRMAAAARAESGIFLSISSGFRSAIARRSGAARTPTDARSREGSAKTNRPLVASPAAIRIAHCPFIVLTPGISAQFLERKRAVQASGNADLQAFLDPRCRRSTACHAEGRGFESLQPLRKRPVFAGLFCVRSRLVRLRRVGLTPDSPRADRRPSKEKTPCLQAHSGSSEPKSFCGACRRSGVRPAAAVSPTLPRRHDPADSARRRDTSGRVRGASPVSVRKPRGQPRPAPRPRRAMAPEP